MTLKLSRAAQATLALVVVAAVVGAILASRGKAIAVQYHVVVPQTALESVLANGQIAGSAVVPLALQKTGTVARIAAPEGTVVKARDTLLTLDNREESNAVTQRRNALTVARLNLQKLSTTDAAQAAEQLAQARAQEELLGKQLERQKALSAGSAVSRSEVDKAQHDYDIAVSQRKVAENAAASVAGNQRQLQESQVAQAQAALDEALIGLSRTVLLAPEDGKVVNRFAQAGQLVTSGTTVLSFLPADTTTHVELLVDEGEISRIRVGQRALVSAATAPGTTFAATVRDIVPSIDPSRGTVTVQMGIAQSDTALMPGQTVSAQIIIGSVDGALVVPQRFLAFGREKADAFVFRSWKAEQRPVTARDLGNGTFLVEKGLSAGDTLVAAPGLKSGSRVKFVTDPRPGRE